MYLPSIIGTPLRFAIGLISLVALGVGLIFGLRWWQGREARKAVEAVPAIAENKAALTSQEKVVVLRSVEYRRAVTNFSSSARRALADSLTTPLARDAINKGKMAITACDSLNKAKDSTVVLLTRRTELLTEDAVRARKGRIFVVSAGVGYEPFFGAPAVRGGVELNLSPNWSVVGTADAAVRMRPGKSDSQKSGFVGLNYRFGGR